MGIKDTKSKDHPVGESVGAAGGAVAGMTVGAAVGGPPGAVVGAASVALLKNWLQGIPQWIEGTFPNIPTTDSAVFEVVVFGCLFILLLHKSRSGMVPLIRDYLVDFHPTAARRFGMFAQARRWCGDRNHGGKGEILVALGD